MIEIKVMKMKYLDILKVLFFFENLAEICNSDYVLYSPVTSPLISFETINDCINYFETNKLRNMATTSLVKHHLWLKGKPLNYEINKSPSWQIKHRNKQTGIIFKKLSVLKLSSLVKL